MFLWICLAILTAAVVGAILAPLAREHARTGPTDADAADLAVYRDQLLEIEADHENGLIDEQAAQAARAELARRIFARQENDAGQNNRQPTTEAETAGSSPPTATPSPSTATPSPTSSSSSTSAQTQLQMRYAYALALCLPVVSIAFYLAIGSPNMPDRPHVPTEIKTAERTNVENLLEQVEARLRDEPRDGVGWNVIAPIYSGLGRFEDAKVAYRQAILILGPTPKRLAGLGQSAVRADNGVIGPQARRAFQQLLTLEPENLEARLWIARAKEQDGDTKGAIAAYQVLLEGADANAPWRKMVEKQIMKLQRPESAARAPGAPPQSGAQSKTVNPRAADVENMSDEQRAKFISQMVERLAARIRKDGSNLGDWIKLVRAYAVLGRVDDAKKVLADARLRFKSDARKGKALDAIERQYKLGS